MSLYHTALAFYVVALVCQTTVSGLSLQCWRRHDQATGWRRLWLSLSLMALFLALQQAYWLEIAVRTGLYDFRQASFSMLAGLLALYVWLQLRRLSA